MAEPFTGEIHIYPYSYAPRDWADCNGQQLAIQQFTALYAIIGTTFGGDGRTTFNLPNLMGRVPMHQGTGPGLTPRDYADADGNGTVTLGINAMPSHNHVLSFEVENTELAAPAGNYPGRYRQAGAAANLYDTSGAPSAVNMGAQALGITGGSQPHANMQPYMVLRFCIALNGVFPVRN